MERKVPSATTDEIQLYRSTLYSLLRSTAEVQIRTLEELHAGMNSLLHLGARAAVPDIPAFIYSTLRLPGCMPDIRSVILGQNADVFRRHGYPSVENWQPVTARARRRRCFFDGKDTLACYIASRSDIEDVIPALTAYQMEWNKMNLLLQGWPKEVILEQAGDDPQTVEILSQVLGISPDDISRLHVIWGKNFGAMLEQIRQARRSIGVRLLSGSLSEYQRATNQWWEAVEIACPCVRERPVYFVSSNTHSLVNLLTGFALHQEGNIHHFIEQSRDAELKTEWQDILSKNVRSSRENFLYYVMKKLQQSDQGKALQDAQNSYELEHGIIRVPSQHTFDIEAQVIELAKIDPTMVDPRVGGPHDLESLSQSDAVIINIDYPLGLSAYNILSKVAEQAAPVLGVYVMGKSASLNARLGDVMIPMVVQDEQSHNTYMFQNCFTAADVAQYLIYGTVLDNQKAISVLGTFLQNAQITDIFFREGYADIEMEGGPFLSAVYEMFRPKRHPVDEIANLYNLPFDLGILHYVSDTPLSKGKNLGAGTLSYFGMDSTYATSVAILRRIIQMEKARISEGSQQP